MHLQLRWHRGAQKGPWIRAPPRFSVVFPRNRTSVALVVHRSSSAWEVRTSTAPFLHSSFIQCWNPPTRITLGNHISSSSLCYSCHRPLWLKNKLINKQTTATTTTRKKQKHNKRQSKTKQNKNNARKNKTKQEKTNQKQTNKQKDPKQTRNTN